MKRHEAPPRSIPDHGHVQREKPLPVKARRQRIPKKNPPRPSKSKEKPPGVLLPDLQGVAPDKPVTPEYRLVECILLWAAVMQGRWPRKRGAIKATARHYFTAARIHDAKNHA
jgi:hypothetical protein